MAGERAVVTAPLAVVAVGGNALVRADQGPDVATQRANAADAAAHLARLAHDHRLVVTHGNGPQVGLLALQAAGHPELPPHPLDVLDAESVGLIGYLLVEALSRHLDPERVAALLTRVEVDPQDPAFTAPTKPVGPWYAEDEGRSLARANGWYLTAGDRGVRRIVASPPPLRVVELDAIRALLLAGLVVVAGGGGGIPVATGDHRGVEAVVDKDLTSALIAERLDADRLVILTDVDAVHLDHGRPECRPLTRTTPAELRAHHFAPGTMGPKVAAVCRFVEATGNPAAIGALDSAAEVLAGTAGTTITL